MPNGASTTLPNPQATQAQQTETTGQQEETARGSFLDPDVLVFALPFAGLIDILDVLFSIGTVATLILGAPLILWMVWKTGSIQEVKEKRQGIAERRAQRIAKQKATRRALRRGILYFLGGLIPFVNIFVLWTWAVISTVRGK